MATIEELEHRSNAIYTAEGAALAGLVAAMRELAVELPDGSRLATISRSTRGTSSVLWMSVGSLTATLVSRASQ